ncbi:MAG: M15 family metallopeptidase [Caldicoprobacterales bacterium]
MNKRFSGYKKSSSKKSGRPAFSLGIRGGLNILFPVSILAVLTAALIISFGRTLINNIEIAALDNPPDAVSPSSDDSGLQGNKASVIIEFTKPAEETDGNMGMQKVQVIEADSEVINSYEPDQNTEINSFEPNQGEEVESLEQDQAPNKAEQEKADRKQTKGEKSKQEQAENKGKPKKDQASEEKPANTGGNAESIVVSNPSAVDVLVNKKYELPADYKPKDLVTPNVPFAPGAYNKKMRKEAAGALEELFKAASAEGINLYAVSGFRSYATQKTIFQRNVKSRGSVEAANRYSAKPGYSEHQTGLAMDVTSKSVSYLLTSKFGEKAEGKWLKNNAHKYGFIIRFPKGKEKITGYIYEPWHIRYLGVDLATAVYESGLTYEEYLGE